MPQVIPYAVAAAANAGQMVGWQIAMVTITASAVVPAVGQAEALQRARNGRTDIPLRCAPCLARTTDGQARR